MADWIENKMVHNIKGYNLDAYLMALEGWRKGLKCTWLLEPKDKTNIEIIGFNPIGKLFSLEDVITEKRHYFYRSRGDLVCNKAVNLVHDKYETKNILLKNSINTPKGFRFNKGISFERIKILMNDNKVFFPMVIKPVFGSLGKGIITNISNESDLERALTITKQNQEYTEFILEEYIEGKEYRLYVISNEVVAITERAPANVLGDGIHTIEQLIDLKNKERIKNPYLKSRLITVDQDMKSWLKKNELSLDFIPKKNQDIILRGQGNITQGGEPINITQFNSTEINTIAIGALNSIDYLSHGGVDVIVQNGQPYVLEINATAGISMHMFPSKGKPINVPQKIIDYYFPNVKTQADNLKDLYFDYKELNTSLRKGYVESITIKNAPQHPLFKIRYIISGKVQGVGYRQWIRRQAVLLGLHGYTRNLQNGKVVVIAATDKKDILEKFKKLCYQGPKRARVDEVKVLTWDKSIKLGFFIKKSK